MCKEAATHFFFRQLKTRSVLDDAPANLMAKARGLSEMPMAEAGLIDLEAEALSPFSGCAPEIAG